MKTFKYAPNDEAVAIKFREYPQYDTPVKILEQIEGKDNYDYAVLNTKKNTLFFVFEHQLIEKPRQ